MNREEKKIMDLTMTSHGLIHLFEGALLPFLLPVIAKFGIGDNTGHPLNT